MEMGQLLQSHIQHLRLISMGHRHLNHERYTFAAIDDVIERGGRTDWAKMRRAAETDPEIAKKSSAYVMLTLRIPMPRDTIFGGIMQSDSLPEWERLSLLLLDML